MLRAAAALPSLPPPEICRVRWLFYRGDENYGLGNVLYDVSSAAALAIALNRTLLYGRDENDRKFGTLLTWPGSLTWDSAEALRKQAGCPGRLNKQRHVMLTPDKCTFYRTWRRERSGHLRCLKRLLGVNWVAERAPVLELSKVHAFTGLQTFLKSVHEPVRRQVRAVTGGCIRDGERPNVHGALLSTLMRPVPAVLHAVHWAMADLSALVGSSEHQLAVPSLSLHMRAMSDSRAKNSTSLEQATQMLNALMCIRRAGWSTIAASEAYGGPAILHRQGMRQSVRTTLTLPVLIVSSSPELRAQLVRRVYARGARRGAVASGNRAAAMADKTQLVPFVFDWRRYAAHAPQHILDALSTSETAAATFCSHVSRNDSFRCSRASHLRDWGPEPHWVAVVELLLLATTTRVIVGAGYPYFKVCNTFAQIGAALADARPTWLGRDLSSIPSQAFYDRRARGSQDKADKRRGVRLLCASRVYSIDWGSSMWRTLNATKHHGADAVIDCGSPSCLAPSLQPELWPDLAGDHCPTDSDTLYGDRLVFGQALYPLLGRKASTSRFASASNRDALVVTAATGQAGSEFP